MRASHRDAQRQLFEIAETQQGLFTTKQAKAAGFAENTHPYHVQVGNWIREHRGIYRLALFPVAEHPDLAKWALWSHNRDGVEEGVYSHQTALSFHELSDVNPAKLHMTVPSRFRRNSAIPGILVLHRANLTTGDVETAHGFRVTRPLRTILDLAEAGTIERGFLRQAIRQALQRGLISRAEIKRAKPSAALQSMFNEILKQVA